MSMPTGLLKHSKCMIWGNWEGQTGHLHKAEKAQDIVMVIILDSPVQLTKQVPVFISDHFSTN